MPDTYSRPDLGPPGAVTGVGVLGTSTGKSSFFGKSVTYVEERRFLNNYKQEVGEEPEERTERTGRTREARDGDTCWQECEEVTNTYARKYEFTLVEYEDWTINTTLQAYYDGVNSWTTGTVGAGGSIAGAGATGVASTSAGSAAIAEWLLGDAATATGVEILGGEVAATAGAASTGFTVAGLGLAAFYVTTNIMDSAHPAGTKDSEGWQIVGQKFLGERLWRRGVPKWVQCGDKHPCSEPPKRQATGSGASGATPQIPSPTIPAPSGGPGSGPDDGGPGQEPEPGPGSPGPDGSTPVIPGPSTPPPRVPESGPQSEEGLGEDGDVRSSSPPVAATPSFPWRLIAIVASALAVLGVVLGIVFSVGGGKSPTTTPPLGTPAPSSPTHTSGTGSSTTGNSGATAGYSCSGVEFKLFDNWSPAAVENGGGPSTFSTDGKPYCFIAAATYHWNNGSGAVPGTIALKRLSGPKGVGSSLPPTVAVPSAGQNGAQNVNWVVSRSNPTVNPLILDGTYECWDSDPATWSQSSGAGFCWVEVTSATKTKAGTS
ncbi:MAG TPA: hypothetical protein VEH29_02820 [Acidimicrobiales bacterium]|nr:hypothetical protein [Acidimicrobiales bacterium]